MNRHEYDAEIVWTGNRGSGTASYTSYGRMHEIRIEGKPVISGSSDTMFRGNPERHNPEDLLIAALSACHLLSYLHLCADSGVVVTAYTDRATGTMELTPDGGHFIDAVLRPAVTIAPGSDAALAEALHHRAHDACFIASSMNFPVRCEPVTTVGGARQPLPFEPA